ncbi:MAG: glycosyltransferase [Pseudomonadota bacterium]
MQSYEKGCHRVTEPLKIAVVAHYFPCLSQTFVLDHVTGMIDRRHNVHVFATVPHPDLVSHGDYDAYELSRITHYWPALPTTMPAKIRFALRCLTALPALRLAMLLRQQGFTRTALRPAWHRLRRAVYLVQQAAEADVVHVHFGDEGEIMAWLAAQGALRGRLVVSLHGFDVNQLLARGGAHYPLLFREADCIVVTTAFMAGQARALGCPAGKLVQIPVGIRTQKFPFAERHWDGREPLRLLTVARLVEFKGVEYAIRAVGRLRAEGVALHYTIVGAGPLREGLGALVERLQLGDCVTFAGEQNRDAVLAQLAGAHLFVLPSHTAADGAQEGQGVVLLEAQACGLPLLATRHGGIPEGCADGVSAVLVSEKDDAALADGLRQLIARRQEWPAMGRAGRRLVESRYDLAGHLDQLEQVYVDVRSTPETPT